MRGERPLSPDEAIRRFKADPSSVLFDMPNVMRLAGLTPDELRAELVSGRLKAVVMDRSPRDLSREELGRLARVDGAELLRWMTMRRTLQ